MGPFHLFERYGVELEYMLVDACSLNILPEADAIFALEAGETSSDVERGDISWSNELVKHVVELKTTEPAYALTGLVDRFQEEVNYINELAKHKLEACLLPTGMHPWMNPLRETIIWPHENTKIYQTYNRIFNCQGHGWSNLQSTHINLPFYDEAEFIKLHAAVRVLLPILSALSASTPICDGKYYGFQDQRLEVYRSNQQKIPVLTGDVIPEPVTSMQQYHDEILGKAYAAISPFDPEQVMQNEWLNSRGAITRFTRGAIEIRTIDLQECPRADLAILQLIVMALKNLVELYWSSYETQQRFPQAELVRMFLSVIKQGGDTVIDSPAYLELFNLHSYTSLTVRDLWQHLLQRVESSPEIEPASKSALELILTKGALAQRILSRLGMPAVGSLIDPAQLKEVFQELVVALQQGKLWSPT